MEQEKIIAYKGFDKDFKCRGYQYEVGKEYEEDGAICCEKGFHACGNPIDVWEYYSITDSRFAIVEQSGKIDKQENKTCSSKIKIKAELKFADFVKLCVDAVAVKCKFNSENDNGGDSAQIGSSGECARIGSSGNYAQIGSSGDYAQIGSSGDYAQIGSSSYYAQIGSSGNYAQIGSSGDCARIGSSGYDARIGSSGECARIGSSGNYAQIGSSGDYAQIGSSSYYAQIGSSGDYAQIGSSSYYAQIGSSGNYARIGSSGDCARIKSEGQRAVIMCAGGNSKARAKKGSWITLAEYDDNRKPVCVKTEQVDGERIKEDTWYQLIDGEFKEVKL